MINNISEHTKDIESKSLKLFDSLVSSLSFLHPSISVIGGIYVDLKGKKTRLSDICDIGKVDDYTLLITPYDLSNIKHLTPSIQKDFASDRGVLVQSSEKNITAKWPAITNDRRERLKTKVNEIKNNVLLFVRNNRSNIKKQFVDDIKSKEEKGRLQKQLDDIFKVITKKIEDVSKSVIGKI